MEKKIMKKITKKQQEINEAKLRLLEYVHPGDEIQTILRHVSTSGMLRIIALKKVHKGYLIDLTYSAAIVLGMTMDTKHNGIRISGCGMDMGLSLVYNLAYALFGTTKTIAEEGHDAGYLLKQRWI